MDRETARALAALNNRFYRENAASFSSTRNAPWQGWERCLESLGELPGGRPANGATLSVLDIAAGNLRFERLLAKQFPDVDLRVLAVDACMELAADAAPDLPFVHLRNHDVLEALIDREDTSGAELLGTGPGRFDLVACFGFMHHVPGRRLRSQALSTLVDAVRPGGIVALSFWQFGKDRRLAGKAADATGRARSDPSLTSLVDELEPGDAFLGWQDTGSLRYCHSFSDDELDALTSTVSDRARVIGRFRADGKTGRLNAYLILQRRSGDEP